MLLGAARKRLRAKSSPFAASRSQTVIRVSELEGEDEAARKQCYLVTFPHPRTTHTACGRILLAPGDFIHEGLFRAFHDCCQNPEYTDLRSVQRACSVDLDLVCVVFEKHQEDEAGQVYLHGHVGCDASTAFRFLPVKRALLSRHGLVNYADLAIGRFQ